MKWGYISYPEKKKTAAPGSLLGTRTARDQSEHVLARSSPVYLSHPAFIVPPEGYILRAEP